MRGTMLWFNREKDLGVIESEEGERLDVTGGDFASGLPPVRCRGTSVVFEPAGGDGARATAVVLVEDDAPRRARRRSAGRSYA